MYPDFLDALGLDLYGLNFERALWLIALAFAGWGLYGGVAQIREGEREAGLLRCVISVALGLFGGGKFYMAWFSAQSYSLVFSEELILRSYALAIVTGFILGVWVAAREARRVGIPASRVLDLAFWCLVFGMLGARVVDSLVSIDVYVAACNDPASVGLNEPDCFRALKFWEGGLTFYGAFLGSVPVIWWFSRKYDIRLPMLMDTVMPSLALGHAFGRLGCLGAGCCWGDTCTSGFGLTFQRGEMPFIDSYQRYMMGDSSVDPNLIDSGHTEVLHPTQLYESLGEMAIFAALLLWRPHKRVHGEILALWMSMYGFFRVITEMTRGDKVRGYVTEIEVGWLNELLRLPPEHVTFLTTSQVIGLVLGVGGLALFTWLRRRKTTPAPLAA